MGISQKIIFSTLPISLSILIISLGVTFYTSQKSMDRLAHIILDSKSDEILELVKNAHDRITSYNHMLSDAGAIDIQIDHKQAEIEIQTAFADLVLGKAGFVFIVDNESRAIKAHTSLYEFDKNVAEKDWYTNILGSKSGFDKVTIEDQEFFIRYNYFEEWNWYIISALPTSEIYGITRKSKDFVLFTAFLEILALILSVLFVAKKITTPIENLRNGAVSIANGVWDVNIQVNTKDEIGELAESFDTMLVKLKHSMSEQEKAKNLLEDLNKDLEDRVIARTEELEQERAKNIESSRLAALGEMACGIAHEINNPLAIIISNLAFLKKMNERKQFSEATFLRSLSNMQDTVMRISKIISGLRIVAQDTEAYQAAVVPSRDIFEDVLGICSEKFKNNNVDLIIDLSDPNFSKEIYCDRVRLSQVIINLLNNSFDAVEGSQNKWIKIDFTSNDIETIIKVVDSGHGIPEDIRSKIFNPFFTSKDVGKGTGLGLGISKAMVEEHGGTLEFDANAENTTFIIKIPTKNPDVA